MSEMLSIFKTLQNSSLKLETYMQIYEENFEKFKNKNPVILEIGVRGGGGIELLSKYFNDECEIYGVDIDKKTLQIYNTYPNVKIFLGDQSNKKFMKYVAEQIGKPIDIVIDDGGHFMHQQINSFEALFPHINDNGLYLIEDTGTSFDNKFNNKTTCTLMEYMSRISHGLTNMGDPMYKQYIAHKAYSICFYDGIVVIHKKTRIPFNFIYCDKNGYKDSKNNGLTLDNLPKPFN